MTTRVLLADDHPMVRQGVRFLLAREGYEVVAEARDGHEALSQARATRPDVAILDLAMPGMNGLDAAYEMKQASPETKIVILTQHVEQQYILKALRAGIHAYVLKTQAASDLIQAIRDVSRGRTYVSPAVSSALVGAYQQNGGPSPDPLTAREREVLRLVAEGRSTKKIAEILGISMKTAESHRSHIMLKLGIHETAGLVRYAVRRGLVDP